MILNSCDKEDQHCIMYEQCNKEFLSHVFAYWKFHEHEPMVISSMLIRDVLIMYCMIWENESDDMGTTLQTCTGPLLPNLVPNKVSTLIKETLHKQKRQISIIN